MAVYSSISSSEKGIFLLLKTRLLGVKTDLNDSAISSVWPCSGSQQRTTLALNTEKVAFRKYMIKHLEGTGKNHLWTVV